MTRATNQKLAPGEDSIDRVRPTKQKNGSWLIRWRYCDRDGNVKMYSNQAATIGEARRRARAKADELRTTSEDGTWSSSSDITVYIGAVSEPAIEAARLADNSRRRYRLALAQIKARLDGLTIAQAIRFRTLERALQDIAAEHGSESARQARTVFGKYLAQQLIRDEIIDGNPLAGMSIDLSSEKALPPRAQRTLTRDEFKAAIDYLLMLDPVAMTPEPRRGRWDHATAIAKTRGAIDLALLQASSGLRMSEALALTWEVFDDSAAVTASKTGRGRVVPLLFPDVTTHLKARRGSLPDDAYVIGAPADPTKQWERRAATKAAEALYPQIGRAIGAQEVFDHGRSHLWRGALNTLLLTVPDVVRSAYFGHDQQTNQRYYTDVTDTSGLVEALSRG